MVGYSAAFASMYIHFISDCIIVCGHPPIAFRYSRKEKGLENGEVTTEEDVVD